MADLKITELPALTTVLGEDLLAIVDDPTGTASTKKIRTDDYQSGWHVGARVYNSSSISVASGGNGTALTFNTEDYDTDNIHATGTNTDQLTCKTAGRYLIIGNFAWAINTTGGRSAYIMLNAATHIAAVRYGDASSGDQEWQNVACFYDLSVNDYVQLIARQASGGNLDVLFTSAFSPIFSMHKVG